MFRYNRFMLLAALLLGGLTLETTHLTAPLTPPELLPLGGYTERKGGVAQAGGDELGVRILGFRQGSQEVIVASCDMLTIPESLRAAVAAQLPGSPILFLHATHTHCAPDSQMLNDRMTIAIPGIATYRKRWLTWYAEQIAAAIERARQGWQPVRRLEFARWRMPLNRGRRKLAQPNSVASLLRVNGRDAWFNFAAHAVVYDETENKTRRDWPGFMPGAVVTQGALGDVSPAFGEGSPPQRIEAFATQVRARIADVQWERLPMDLGVRELVYSAGTPTPHPNFARENGVNDQLASMVVGRFAPANGRITSLRLGKVAWVGIAGEPTAELGQAVELAGRNIGFITTIPVSHVNGWVGYLLTPEDYRRGGYEANLQLHGPDAGKLMVAAADTALRSLAHPPTRR